MRSLGVLKAEGLAARLIVALGSEQVHDVDYGQSFRVIRGHFTGLISIVPGRDAGTTTVTFTVQWSGYGNLPPWAMQTEIDWTLSVMDEMRTIVLRADATVDAIVEDCAAFQAAEMSRWKQKWHYEEGGLERPLEKVNTHSSTFHVVRRLDFPGAQPRK